MLAAKLPRLETVEVVEEEMPTPGKGEVLIRMKASALCRSDLHALALQICLYMLQRIPLRSRRLSHRWRKILCVW